MNDESAFYKSKSTQADGFVVQEIMIVDKLYNGLKAIAEAEEISVEEVIINFLWKRKVVLTIRIILNRIPLTLRY